jgi:hypothetical protein
MSAASSTKPSRSNHSPNSGRMLKKLPTISKTPVHIRSQRWEGWRNHRAVDRQLLGSRSINCSSRRSRRAMASLASQVSPGRSDLKSIASCPLAYAQH